MQIIHQAPLAVLGMGAAFTILWGVADPMAAFAEVREVEAEGYYMMGDSPEERMDIAQQHAIQLGVCYSYLDDNEKEIECFKKAVELNPNDQTIKENLDRALSRG